MCPKAVVTPPSSVGTLFAALSRAAMCRASSATVGWSKDEFGLEFDADPFLELDDEIGRGAESSPICGNRMSGPIGIDGSSIMRGR